MAVLSAIFNSTPSPHPLHLGQFTGTLLTKNVNQRAASGSGQVLPAWRPLHSDCGDQAVMMVPNHPQGPRGANQPTRNSPIGYFISGESSVFVLSHQSFSN